MIELPANLRDMLVEQLEEFLEGAGSNDPEAVAEYTVQVIQTSAEELEIEDGDEIVSQLEASGELEGNLDETIQETMETSGISDVTAEEVISLLERLCEIDWLANEEEDEEDEVRAEFFEDQDNELVADDEEF